ncbi:hypothetical protein CYMTET_19175 [Cymbomonas tetramitiformis]|uniref:Ataxin-10 domain-containing protein n=1 Tax=Cymbomonas tetramitiformis TaxID=36881 RepID=A0AAE0L5G2_9CHLO|nr:hypothetical protein CYMTET_19175 [Cymbomonas tetramitiformis]
MEEIKGAPWLDGELADVISITEKSYHPDGSLGSTEVVIIVTLENGPAADVYGNLVLTIGEDTFDNDAYYDPAGDAYITEVRVYSDNGLTLLWVRAPEQVEEDTGGGDNGMMWAYIGIAGAVAVVGIAAAVVYYKREDLGLVEGSYDDDEGYSTDEESTRLTAEAEREEAEAQAELEAAERDAAAAMSAEAAETGVQIEGGVPAHVLELVKGLKDPAKRTANLKAIAELTMDRHNAEARRHVVRAGAIPLLVAELETKWYNRHRPTASQHEGMRWALLSLAHITRTRGYRHLVRKHNLLPKLTALLALDGLFLKAPDLVKNLLQVVANITVFNKTNQRLLQRQHAPLNIAKLLSAVPHSSPIWPFAVKAFNHVISANMNVKQKAACMKSHILRSLIPALEPSLDNSVKVSAVESINKMCAHSAEFVRQFQAEGGAAPLVRLLDPMNAVKSLLKHVVGTLMTMTRREVTMRSEVMEEGGVAKLVNLMSRDNEPLLVERSAWTLNNMAAGNPAVPDSVRENGGIHALVRLLERAESKNSIKATLAALFHLAQENPDNQDAVREAGGLALLVKHANGEVLNTNKEVAMLCLKNVFADNEANKALVMELGGQDLMERAQETSLPGAPRQIPAPRPPAPPPQAGAPPTPEHSIFADRLLVETPEGSRPSSGNGTPALVVAGGAGGTPLGPSPGTSSHPSRGPSRSNSGTEMPVARQMTPGSQPGSQAGSQAGSRSATPRAEPAARLPETPPIAPLSQEPSTVFSFGAPGGDPPIGGAGGPLGTLPTLNAAASRLPASVSSSAPRAPSSLQPLEPIPTMDSQTAARSIADEAGPSTSGGVAVPHETENEAKEHKKKKKKEKEEKAKKKKEKKEKKERKEKERRGRGSEGEGEDEA